MKLICVFARTFIASLTDCREDPHVRQVSVGMQQWLELCNYAIVLADHTACSMIDIGLSSVCLSVCLSVCDAVHCG